MPLLRYKAKDSEEIIEAFDDEMLEVEPEVFQRKGGDENLLYIKEANTDTRTVGISIGYRHMYPIYDSAHLSKKVSDQYAKERDQEENLNRFQKSTFKRL